MVSEEIIIQTKSGLHARPASILVSLIRGFRSEVTLLYGNKQAKGTSIISILALGLKSKSELKILVDGEDESETLKAVIDFFRNLKD